MSKSVHPLIIWCGDRTEKGSQLVLEFRGGKWREHKPGRNVNFWFRWASTLIHLPRKHAGNSKDNLDIGSIKSEANHLCCIGFGDIHVLDDGLLWLPGHNGTSRNNAASLNAKGSGVES